MPLLLQLVVWLRTATSSQPYRHRQPRPFLPVEWNRPAMARTARSWVAWLSAWLFLAAIGQAADDTALAGAPAKPAIATTAGRPNIVFVLVDDLRFDDLACMGHPFVRTPHADRLAREGALFQNAFCTTPLCSPSRACILTGQFAHRHGVTDNTNHDALSHRLTTFLAPLKQAGYTTAFFGKWHMGTDDTPRPGIDRWVSFKGQGQFVDPELNVDGHLEQATGYATDLLNQRAVDFIRQRPAQPFVLYLSHKAMHPNLQQRPDGSVTDPSAAHFVPAPRHRDLYAAAEIRRRPNALIDRPWGKPALLRSVGNLPPLSRATGSSDQVILDRLRLLAAVDEGLGQILAALEEIGQLDQTVVVLTSDHGYFYGEHGLSVERRLAYEEAIRVPLLVRYPPRVAAGLVVQPMVQLIDLCPTFLELGQAALPPHLHGRSLEPLLSGRQSSFRDAILIEYFSDHVFPRMDRMGYQAVRTSDWKYIAYRDLKPGEVTVDGQPVATLDELYDLKNDPYELTNLISSPAAQPTLTRLQGQLRQLLEETK